jgi:hypothetical protein
VEVADYDQVGCGDAPGNLDWKDFVQCFWVASYNPNLPQLPNGQRKPVRSRRLGTLAGASVEGFQMSYTVSSQNRPFAAITRHYVIAKKYPGARGRVRPWALIAPLKLRGKV